MISTFVKLLGESPVSALCFVFWVGALTSLSSCTILRIPAILGFVAGSPRSRKRTLLLTALFTGGLVASTVLLGTLVVSAGGFADRVLDLNKYVFWFLGVSLLVAGVVVSGLVSPHFLAHRWPRLEGRLANAGLAGTFVFGAAFGLVAMPACPSCGAGLLALAGIVVAKHLSAYGFVVFLSFALGQSVPIVAVAVLASLVKPDLIKWLRTRICSIEQRMQLLSGNVLIVLGIYFIVVG